MKPDGNDGLAEVMNCTQAFVDALKSTPLVRHYQAAEQKFRADPGVQKLLAELRKKVEAFQRGREEGTASQEDIQELRDMQKQFQAHPSVQDFQEALQAVGLLFQETNEIISKVLGVDFGQTAGPAGGAC